MTGEITNLFEIKRKRNYIKLCRCELPKYEIDEANYIVICTKCGAYVNPFEAISQVSRHQESLRNTLRYYRDEIKKATKDLNKIKADNKANSCSEDFIISEKFKPKI